MAQAAYVPGTAPGTIAATIERWKQADLSGLLNSADTAAAEIAQRQEDSDSSRARLVDLVKEFRFSAPDEVRKQVQPLLKSFQTEVDSLLKRSKCAEAAFLHVYKTLTNLPDHSSIVEYLGQLEERLVENTQLRQSLEEHNQQVTANKIQEAERSRELLVETESKVAGAVKEQVSVQLAEKEKDWSQERLLMERRLTDSEDQVGILRRELDRSHAEVSRSRLTNGQGQSEDEKITLLAEDLDRANSRATTAEFKIAELQQHLSSLQKQVNKAQDSGASSDMDKISSRGQPHQHADGVQRLRDELDRLKSSYQSQFNRMEDQLSRLSSQNAMLLSKLDGQRDYDQVKQELSLLKSAHYSEEIPGGTLESVLMARNRRLESENAGLRVREMELAGLTMRHRTNGNGASGGLHNQIHVDSYLHGNGHHYSSSDGDGDRDTDAPSPEEDDYSDDLGELETNLTPEMMAKVSEAKSVLQSLNTHVGSGSSANAANGGRFMNTLQVADQVNRVLEEEGITRCALAKFVLHGSYKMVYDALHDPRPWGFLNSAGRDKYRKLKLWAEDSRSVNAVKVLQVYCKDKRQRQSNFPDGSPPSFTTQDTPTAINGGSYAHGTDELPTDLSLPKSLSVAAFGKKAFESLLAGEKGASWLPRNTSFSSSQFSMAMNDSNGHMIPRRFYSQKDTLESRSPDVSAHHQSAHSLSQALPVVSKRTSPQHSVPRRQSKDSSLSHVTTSPAVSSSAANGSSSMFRPSASFTASPVALGISFPDYRKNVLHQITDDMINQYDPLDTDTVTRAVRSKLNKCNVSQRLFGEVVLGMSQGAVSDLLKRPKPWNKLTRPTKEHYVRMQQFLEDEQSIPVLQAIQNREDPERVLAAPAEEDEDNRTDIREMWKKEESPQSSSSPSMVSMTQAPVLVPALTAPLTSDMVGASDSELSEREAFQAVKDHFAKFYTITDVSRQIALDTVVVASRIKEELRSRNLQQKLIGELVLDVGQGTVSELLNKPKPFGMLSMKGRENYMKLLKLLQTAEDFALLEALRTQGQQKANANKRGRTSDGDSLIEKRSKTDHRRDSHDLDSIDDSENHGRNGLQIDNSSFYNGKFSDEEDAEDDDGEDGDREIINGVCVPKSAMRARGHYGASGDGLNDDGESTTVIVHPSAGIPFGSHRHSGYLSRSHRGYSRSFYDSPKKHDFALDEKCNGSANYSISPRMETDLEEEEEEREDNAVAGVESGSSAIRVGDD